MWVKAAAFGLILAAAAQDPAADEKKKKEEEAKAKIAEFRKELKTCKANGDVCLALQNLGSIQHPKILQELEVWLRRPEAEICGGAGEQIAKYTKDRVAAEMLMTAAKSRKDSDGIIKCLRYAGDVGLRITAPMFNNYFRHKDVDVAKEAVDSLGKLKSASSVDPLIRLLRELDDIRDDVNQPGSVPIPGVSNLPGGSSTADDNLKRKNALLPSVRQALSEITGERWGTAKEWEAWWRKNKGTFKEKE